MNLSAKDPQSATINRKLVLMVLAFSTNGAYAQSDPILERITESIEREGASWVAEVLPSSKNVFTKNRSNDLLDEMTNEEITPFTDFDTPKLGDLPEYFDWRNIDGNSFVAPVSDQGDCGSCVSFAVLNTFETQLNIDRNTHSSPWSFSRQYFFSCGGGLCKGGWKLSQAVEFLKTEGVPDANCLEYSSGTSGKDVPCETSCPNADERSDKIESYERPTIGYINIEKIKRALLKGPLLSSMILFEDFMYYSGGVYSHVAGEQIGGHAITLIGWDDKKRAWIGRNSMGTDWGENGDLYIAWNDETLIGRYTYQFKTDPRNEYIFIENLRTNVSLSGIVELKISTGFPNAEGVELYVTKDPYEISDLDPFSKQISFLAKASLSENSDNVNRSIDTSTLENGRQYIFASIRYNNRILTSQPVAVVIDN
jgi:hypothetical protein